MPCHRLWRVWSLVHLLHCWVSIAPTASHQPANDTEKKRERANGKANSIRLPLRPRYKLPCGSYHFRRCKNRKNPHKTPIPESLSPLSPDKGDFASVYDVWPGMNHKPHEVVDCCKNLEHKAGLRRFLKAKTNPSTSKTPQLHRQYKMANQEPEQAINRPAKRLEYEPGIDAEK